MSDDLVEYSSTSEMLACIKAASTDLGLGEIYLHLITDTIAEEQTPPLTLTYEQKEDEVLGEIFSLSPRSSSSQGKYVPRSVFLNSVLVIKGLTTFLSQPQTVCEKETLLNLEILSPANEEENIVFVILSYISQSMISRTISVYANNEDTRWMEEAVKCILELTKETVAHPFLADCREICREFLNNVLLPDLVNGEGGVVLKIAGLFSSNKDFGSIILKFLLQKYLETGDSLREAERFKLESGPTLETFLAHHRVMLEVWPSFAQAICDMTAPGKRKERAVKPRLSLSETGGLVEELGRWLEVLDEATRELSVIQPQFFLAVTNISQLISGAIQKITKQRV